jgi:pimeloyl-ACP methyl ester carboxylesterase
VSARQPERTQLAGLSVVEWPGPGPAVLGLPGLTSTSGAFQALADALPGRRVVSLDLRGRGAAMVATGPTGLMGHAQDVARVMRELDLTDVVVVGHSMGAFLAPLVAKEVPDRVQRLVLLDGGVPPAFPPLMGPGLIRLVFRRQLRAMDRDWANTEAVAKKRKIDRIVEGREDLRLTVLAMLRADLRQTTAGLRPQLDVERCVADAVDTFTGEGVRGAISGVTVPVDLLLAQHGKHHGARAFLSDKAVAAVRSAVPQLTVRRLPVNHVTILFAPEVADAVAG